MTHFLAQLFTRDVNLVILGAVLGTLLTFAYDRLTNRATRRADRRSTLAMLLREATANLTALDPNEQALNTDLAAQPEQKHVVAPLASLADTAWGLALAGRSLSDGDHVRLSPLATAYDSVHKFNDLVASRENYRLQNESMTNFHDRMVIFDKLLLQQISVLRQRLPGSITALRGEFGQRISPPHTHAP